MISTENENEQISDKRRAKKRRSASGSARTPFSRRGCLSVHCYFDNSGGSYATYSARRRLFDQVSPLVEEIRSEPYRAFFGRVNWFIEVC